MATTANLWIPQVEQAAACRECEQVAYGSSASLKQWQQLLSNKAVVAIAAGSCEHPTGVAVARFDSGFKLLLCAVRPTARRKGVAATLVKLLGENHELELKLRETATVALKFAVAVGFVPQRLERESYGSGCDAVILKRAASN